MNKEKTFIVKHVIDLTEDASYSLIDGELQNKATVVIKNEEITVYMEDNSPKKEFGSDFDALVRFADDNGFTFIKLMNGNHRWYKYNPNPKSRNIGDCTLRAYCAAYGIDWGRAFDIASGVAKENSSMIQYVADKVLTEHFNAQVDETYKCKAKDRITVNEFAMSHPYGIYVLHVRSHMVTVKNGEYWDSWDSGDKKVDKIYIVKK